MFRMRNILRVSKLRSDTEAFKNKGLRKSTAKAFRTKYYFRLYLFRMRNILRCSKGYGLVLSQAISFARNASVTPAPVKVTDRPP